MQTPFLDYAADAMRRSVLFWDTLRRRGNAYLAHKQAGSPALLKFRHEVVMDGRTLPRPANYALLRILPQFGETPTEVAKRPVVVIDPRAGHGPGIGGFKPDSEIGVALAGGHPTYFVTFFPEPCPGQRLVDVAMAEAAFLEAVRAAHPDAEAPVVIGNCQAGWAIMGLAALRPELPGPLIIAGSPLSYWAGAPGLNPMRYSGGNLGGSWLTHLTADLGNGRFDGAHLVLNFESMNPDNTWFRKYWNLYEKADTEPARFLDFERWWGGYFLMNGEEITAIVDELFIGNRLARGEVTLPDGRTLDLRNIQAPICVLCSWGDDITPPQQALNWILDLYASDADLAVQGQTIVYCVHPKVGHLGIFVSAGVARKEHDSFISLIDLIETLPPGLYEMVVDERGAATPGAEFVQGDFATRFERRGLADIAALVGDREGERPFELVRRVSEMMTGSYKQFAQPSVRAMANETTAQAQRALHPLRMQRWALSDLNPWLWSVSAAVPMIEHLPKADPDNPFLAAERRFGDLVEHGWKSWAEARDKAAEARFNAVYGSAALRAALGMADAPAPRPLAADPARVALAEREAEALVANAGEATVQEGIVRLLLAVLGERGGATEQIFFALRALRDGLPAGKRLPLPQVRRIAREQALLLRTDREAALGGLRKVFAREEDRRLAERVLRTVAAAEGIALPDAAYGLLVLKALAPPKPTRKAPAPSEARGPVA